MGMGFIKLKKQVFLFELKDSNVVNLYVHYIKMTVCDIDKILTIFMPINTIYPYKAGDKNVVNSSM